MLARIAEYACGEDLLPEMYRDAVLGPFAAEGQGEPVTGQDATWADDSACIGWAPAKSPPEEGVRACVAGFEPVHESWNAAKPREA